MERVQQWLGGLLVLACLAWVSNVGAQTTVRYQQVLKGGAAMIGNAHYLRSSDFGNPIVVNDVDGDASTAISSSADLILPSGSTIMYAYLTVQTGYQTSQGIGPMTSVKFRVPGGSYTTLTSASAQFLQARTTTEAASGGTRFYRQIMFNVTSLMPANGYVSNAGGSPLARYFVADPAPGFTAAGTGDAARSRLGGWSLIVVYRHANALPRSITVADNWQFFGSGALSIDTDVPNVQLPNGGTVTATVGVAATYGDPSGTTGGFTCGNCDDFLSFGIAGGTLTDLSDPVRNVTSDALNSTIGWAAGNDVSTDGGPAISGSYAARNPATGFTPSTYTTVGTWGSADYDSDIFNASGLLPADGSIRTLRFRQRSLGNDWLVSGSYFVSVETGTAALRKSLTPAAIVDGGVGTYTFTLDNTSPTSVNLTGVGFTDNLPSSLRVANPAAIANTCGGTVTAASGATAIVASGITLNAGVSCTISVNVTNVPGQTNTSCAANPAAFTNSTINITGTTSALFPDFNPVCLVVQPAATIVVVKDAVPNDAQDFAFTATGTGLSAFSLDDDGDATLSNTRNFTGLAAGSYTITETAVAGWALTGLVCSDPTGNSSGNTGTRVATIDVAAGETVTCTYTNTKRAQFRLAKTWDVNSAVGDVATIAATTGLANNTAAFNSPATAAMQGAAVGVLVGETASLPAETMTPAGALANYLTSLTCDNGVVPSGANGQAANTVQIPGNLAVDTLITCTYTNTRRTTTLQLRKQWSGAAVGDDATVTLTRAGAGIDSLASDAGSAGELDSDATPTTVFAGETVVVAESLAGANAGAYNGSLACTGSADANPNDGITVAAADTAIVCTYTNTRRSADLSVAKTNGASLLTAGSTTTYTVTVRNQGPDAAHGAVVRDTPGAQLSGCTVIACAPIGAAACPATPANLLAVGGAAVPTLPNASGVVFTLQCTVL
ncbi:DUF11 domain-containing protein [Lysobacter sp. Root604]|uniref:DUF7933 domain-containing protein n=1 Tax=Lysobacter sp. Root604 TaxID=1736568 RepID=UPI0007014534|nr:DUF11 domain-containing protein [Lysobacter sp. Root604]KRA16123.1 hypothetical protein ASD69_15425 [Lysobacter sp. Root604]